MLDLLLLLISIMLASGTALPLLRYERWWVRMFDFPRLQIAAASGLVLLALAWRQTGGAMFWTALALALVTMLVQFGYVIPYTRLWRKETHDAVGGHPTLTLLMANVLMTNRNAEPLVAFIQKHRPDIIVLDEPDAWWEQALRGLEADFPHTLKEPRPNTYGMLLYSRLPFVHKERRYMIESEVPSFHICVQVGGCDVRLYFVHPKPPYPREAKSTAGRDAELVMVGKLAAREPGPTIVAGDLNDVAWSHTTRLFQRISRTLDPRRGRGNFNTFHAGWWFMRWPLDHLFHSEHFRLVRMQRGASFGSDHFPIVVALELDPAARDEQEPPERSVSDEREAQEKVRLATTKTDPDE
ncbi:MAG: endonuclease/exonuclease/phosphatase family protein [Burkholderiaceae bacterium]